MLIVKGNVITEKFGAKLEVLSHPSRKGLATVKVLEAGEMLEARVGEVIKNFSIHYGLLQFEVADA